jgi:AcrR family transcriptional regulator
VPKEDRRIRRTKRLLRYALVSLVLERGYASITVEDITNRADLGRATFYSHYADKDALFDHIATELTDELGQRLIPVATEASARFSRKPALELFRHAAEESDAYRILLRGEGDGRMLRRFMDRLAAGAEALFQERADSLGVRPRISVEVLAHAWVGEQLAVLRWWLEADPQPLSREEVADMLWDLSLHGRYWATGLDGEPPRRTLRTGG